MCPYIDQDRRMDFLVNEDSTPETAGELNYLITERCLAYLDSKGTSYSTLNEIIGVLTCAQQEFYRRVVAEYENKKAVENGDVYGQS